MSDAGVMTKEPLLQRLQTLADKAERGVSYGFEQTIWKECADELTRFGAELEAMTNSRDAYSDALLKEASRERR